MVERHQLGDCNVVSQVVAWVYHRPGSCSVPYAALETFCDFQVQEIFLKAMIFFFAGKRIEFSMSDVFGWEFQVSPACCSPCSLVMDSFLRFSLRRSYGKELDRIACLARGPDLLEAAIRCKQSVPRSLPRICMEEETEYCYRSDVLLSCLQVTSTKRLLFLRLVHDSDFPHDIALIILLMTMDEQRLLPVLHHAQCYCCRSIYISGLD